jgi:hypothetical protein
MKALAKARTMIGAMIALATVLTFADTSSAQMGSPVCTDLQAQYVSLLRQGSGQGRGQRMVDMDRLSRELAQAQAAARAGSCQRFLFFGPKPSPQCPAIVATIGRLQREIAQSRRGGGFGGGFERSPDVERARLREWMQEYGCQIPSAGGSRTICVRLCDGYYFPISNSANRQRVAQDSDVCQSMYAEPGKAELFTQNGGDVANAVSVTGQRYGDQPYAFLYRQAFNPACAVELKEGIAALSARYASFGSRQGIQDGGDFGFAPTIEPPRPAGPPMPNLRPAAIGEDPETAIARAGDFTIGPYIPPDQRPTGAMVSASGMRQVGASYYAELFDPNAPPVELPKRRGALGFDLIGQAIAMQRERRASEAGQPLPQ